MLKNILTVIVILGLSTAILSACGENTDMATTSDVMDDTAREMVIWGSWSGTGMELFEAQVAQFNADHPHIVARYVMQPNFEVQLLTAIAAGDVPDGLLWDRFATNLYAPRGALMSVDNFIARDSLNVDIFYSEAVREMQNGGQTYGLPLVVDNRALFFNREIFREVGLDPDRPPQTWDELREFANLMTIWDGDQLLRSGFTLQDVGLFNTWIMQAGGDMLTDDLQNTAFNNEAGMTVLNFWDSLLNDDKVYVLGFTDGLEGGQNPFITGHVAMMWDGPWSISNLARYAPDLDYGVAPLPAGPGGYRGARMGGFGLAIASGSSNADEAWEFAKWLTVDADNNREFAYVTGNIPANIEAANNPVFTGHPHFSGIVENMQFAQIRPPVVGYASMEGDALIPSLQLFMSGELSAEQALNEAQLRGDIILADNR